LIIQGVKDWEAFVTLDGFGFEKAGLNIDDLDFPFTDLRFKIQSNAERKYSLWNQIDSIRRSGSDPSDIIVSLDGDDWFSRSDVLRIILDQYADPDCWMTYGSWVSTNPGEAGQMWPAYPDGTTDFRGHRWLGTAVRTWRRWLWDLLEDADLRDERGEYFTIAEDRAIMLSLLEMCGTEHARHIATPIMIYDETPSNYTAAQIAEADANVRLIHGRTPYVKLCKRPLQ
jgi:hypothetical protein